MEDAMRIRPDNLTFDPGHPDAGNTHKPHQASMRITLGLRTSDPQDNTGCFEQKFENDFHGHSWGKGATDVSPFVIARSPCPLHVA